MIPSFKEYFYTVFLESGDDTLIPLTILSGYKYTSGKHSFGYGEKDIPAKDPMNDFKIEMVYNITPELSEIINKYAVSSRFRKNVGGSFHERWASVSATVMLDLPEDIIADLYQIKEDTENLNNMHGWEIDDVSKEIVLSFNGLDKLKEDFEAYVFSNNSWRYKPNTGEDRETYWKRMIERERINMNMSN